MPRLDYLKTDPELLGKMLAVSKQLDASPLDHKLRALVELRVSQINGCVYCVDLHSKQARARGETQQRLDTLPVWHEAPFFDERERAALAWAESLTLISECRAPDELYEDLLEHFTEQEAVALTVAVAQINAWNRLSIGFAKLPGA
jgi:AhpD family alkylhydroperoxidase